MTLTFFCCRQAYSVLAFFKRNVTYATNRVQFNPSLEVFSIIQLRGLQSRSSVKSKNSSIYFYKLPIQCEFVREIKIFRGDSNFSKVLKSLPSNHTGPQYSCIYDFCFTGSCCPGTGNLLSHLRKRSGWLDSLHEVILSCA